MARRDRANKRIIRLGVPGAVLLLMVVFALFHLREVEVSGNTRHTSEEIAEGLSGGILTSNTLYLTWKYRDGKVPDTLPFLNSMDVKMLSPFRIRVVVSEKEAVAYLEDDGYIYIDSSGTVIDRSQELYADIPLLTGITLGEVTLYQKLPTETASQLETIRSIIQLLADQGISASEIRFSDSMEITVYIDHIEAQLGQNEYLQEKVANLNKILSKLEGQSGVLHLENFTGGNETATFSPSDEAVQSVADEEESEDTSGTGDSVLAGLDSSASEDSQDGEGSQDEEDSSGSYTVIPMVFDSSGTLVYNVHVENGVVVDSSGSAVSGCTVNENGYIVDAYMNVFDPDTGDLVQ